MVRWIVNLQNLRTKERVLEIAEEIVRELESHECNEKGIIRRPVTEKIVVTCTILSDIDYGNKPAQAERVFLNSHGEGSEGKRQEDRFSGEEKNRQFPVRLIIISMTGQGVIHGICTNRYHNEKLEECSLIFFGSRPDNMLVRAFADKENINRSLILAGLRKCLVSDNSLKKTNTLQLLARTFCRKTLKRHAI